MHLHPTTDLIIIDTETGGLNPNKHCIVELGAVVVEISSHLTIVDQFTIKLKPDRELTSKAISINHYNKKAWKAALDQKAGLIQFLAWLNSHAPNGVINWCSSNPYFHISFLKSSCARYDLPALNNISIAVLDLKTMFIPFANLFKLQSLSLRTLRKWAKLPGPQQHRALQDVLDICRIIEKLLQHIHR